MTRSTGRADQRPGCRLASLAVAIAAPALFSGEAAAQQAPVQTVAFASADHTTTLTGFVFMPSGSGPHPAVVMMHGRAGAYSSRANGRYDASTLSLRHKMWGQLWAREGYLAVLVDGFGPRGYPQGFPRFSYMQRPPEVNEVTVRPLDAAGALAWLGTRPDVLRDRIGLQGWSNGGSAVLAAMAAGAAGAGPHGFRAALAFYPGCGLKGAYAGGLLPSAPVRVLQGDADEEVSPRLCADLVEKSRARGGDIALRLYPGATHDFDDPGRSRQGVAANAAAKEDAVAFAQRFFAEQLGGR